jgi:hypothetical protein
MRTLQLKANLKSARDTIRNAFSEKAIKDQLQFFDYSEFHDKWLHECEHGRPLKRWLPAPVRFWLHHLYQTMLAVRCDLTNHKWVDTSCGGPDSGDMSGYCTRCGYSFHHQLY